MGPQLPGRSGSLVQGGVPAVAALSYGVLDMNSRLLTSQLPFSKDAPGALVPFRADLSNSHHSTVSTEPPRNLQPHPALSTTRGSMAPASLPLGPTQDPLGPS